MSLPDFLLARIAEDAYFGLHYREEAGGEDTDPVENALDHVWLLERWATDRAVKRVIVETMGDDWVTRTLALSYADHPDYDETWRP